MHQDSRNAPRVRVIARQPVSAQGPLWLAMLALLALFALSLAMSPVQAQERPVSFADLAEEVSPAVVNITTSTTVAAQMDRNFPQFPEGAPFQDFFNEFFNRDGQQQPRPRQSQSLGSGFVISDDGYIVTFVTNVNTGKGECVLFDAQNIAAGPICRVIMPYHIPSGAHAFWAGSHMLYENGVSLAE